MFTKNKTKKVSTVAAIAILSASFFTALVSTTTVIMPVQKARAVCVGGQVNSCSDQQTLGSYFGSIISGRHGDNPSKQHYLADAKIDACKSC
jgi:hypothetical protein